MLKKILYWIPAGVWMFIIYSLSSHSRFTATGVKSEDFLIFKTLHVIFYGVLALLVFYALYKTYTQKVLIAIRLSFIISFAYAITDEFHQTFVPTRSGVPRDLIFDALGIVIVLFLIQSQWRTLKKLM